MKESNVMQPVSNTDTNKESMNEYSRYDSKKKSKFYETQQDEDLFAIPNRNNLSRRNSQDFLNYSREDEGARSRKR